MAHRPRFEIFKGRDSRFYWRLIAGNGKIVAQSEGYVRRSDCKWAALSLTDHAFKAEDREIRNVSI